MPAPIMMMFLGGEGVVMVGRRVDAVGGVGVTVGKVQDDLAVEWKGIIGGSEGCQIRAGSLERLEGRQYSLQLWMAVRMCKDMGGKFGGRGFDGMARYLIGKYLGHSAESTVSSGADNTI